MMSEVKQYISMGFISLIVILLTSCSSGNAMFGSVETGFESIRTDKNFAVDLENEDPLPDGCAF